MNAVRSCCWDFKNGKINHTVLLTGCASLGRCSPICCPCTHPVTPHITATHVVTGVQGVFRTAVTPRWAGGPPATACSSVGMCRNSVLWIPGEMLCWRNQFFRETMGACFILIVCIISQNGSRMESYFLKRRILGPDIFKIQTARDSHQWRKAVGGLSVNRQIVQENQYVN